MSRSTPQGEPHDWVTRAADDAIRHHEKTGASGPVTCSSGISPSGPIHLGQPARVPDAALRRRRAAAARRTRAAPARLGRLRPVPQGAGRRRPVVGRAHRAARTRRCRTRGSATHVVRPLQGAGRRGAPRARRRHGGDLPDRALPVGRLPRRGAPRRTPATPRSTPCSRSTAPRTGRAASTARPTDRRARRAGGRGDGRLGRERRRGRGRGGHDRRRVLPVQALLPRLRPRHHHGDGVRRRDDRPRLHLLGTATTTARPTSPRRTRASWCGRPTGRCAGPSSTSTSSRPGWTTRRPGSSFTVGHELVESVWDYPRPAWFGYGFVGFAGVQKMSSSAGGAPTADDALRVLEPGILRWLYVRRQPKQTFDIDFGPEVVRLYDEWDALARKAADPEKRDVQVLAYERASVHRDRRAAADAPRSSCPFRMLVVGGRRDRRVAPSRSAGSSARWGIRTTPSSSSSPDCRGPSRGPRSSCPPPIAPRCARSRTRSRSRRCRARSGSGSRCSSRGCRAISSWSR